MEKNKLQVCEENQGNETKHKKLKTCGAGGILIWYNGDPTRCNPDRMEIMKKYAELVIDVFNKTHLNKYSFVICEYGVCNCRKVPKELVFTAKPPSEYEQDEDEEYPKEFRARVSVTHSYVEFVEIVDPPRLHR